MADLDTAVPGSPSASTLGSAPRGPVGEVWDLDNLIKPTLDAMEGVFGLRAWRGRRQPNDDRVDRIEAAKRVLEPNESVGATIDVWVIE